MTSRSALRSTGSPSPWWRPWKTRSWSCVHTRCLNDGRQLCLIVPECTMEAFEALAVLVDLVRFCGVSPGVWPAVPPSLAGRTRAYDSCPTSEGMNLSSGGDAGPGCGGEQAAAPQTGVDQGDQDGYLDERADHPGQGLARGHSEHSD